MSFCRGQFFFVNNAAILRVGLKRSLQGPVGHVTPLAGASRSATISHFVQRLFSPSKEVDRRVMSALDNVSRTKHTPLRFTPQKRLFSTSAISFIRTSKNVSSATAAAAQVHAAPSNPTRVRSSWPVNSAKPVGYICIVCSVLVFAIVVLGGLTRLTESGLSITEWKPVTGSIPPLSQADWEAEFAKYKQSPEFKELNTDMTLEEYKFIYGMEWSHRLLGRIIGVAFVLPTLYYIARKKVSLRTTYKLLGICGLLGLQGFIGWWMVYSGIDKQLLDERNSKPTVSPYRLATHLGTAFVVYCCMISTGFSILRSHRIMANPKAYEKIFKQLTSPAIQPFKNLSTGLFGLVFATAITGAFVAGLDAGMIYNTFPKMGDGFVPPKDELMDPLYARKSDRSDLWWRNMLENPTTVQLNHRIMAVTTFFSITAVHLWSHSIRSVLPKRPYMWMNATMGLVCLQVTLGICTLIYIVPTDLGAAHQAGALGLLTGILMVVNTLKKPSRNSQILLQRFLEKTAKQAKQKPLQ